MRALIIINPIASHLPSHARLADATCQAATAGWQVDVAIAAAANEATVIARRAANEGVAAVFACGGDGTLNEVANGLLNSDTALGFIPAGTVNIWAREHRLPPDPEQALLLLRDGATRRCDAGIAEWEEEGTPRSRAFLLMAGLGFDGAVTMAVGRKTKRVAGMLAFAAATAAASFKYRSPTVIVEHDGGREQGRLGLLIASNSRLYGGLFRPSPGSLIDDGMLDLFFVDLERVLPGALPLVPRLILSRGEGHRRVQMMQTTDVRVAIAGESGEALLQLDGEVVGTTPVRLSVRTKALRVIVPVGPNPLYHGSIEPSMTMLLAKPDAPTPLRQ